MKKNADNVSFCTDLVSHMADSVLKSSFVSTLNTFVTQPDHNALLSYTKCTNFKILKLAFEILSTTRGPCGQEIFSRFRHFYF